MFRNIRDELSVLLACFVGKPILCENICENVINFFVVLAIKSVRPTKVWSVESLESSKLFEQNKIVHDQEKRTDVHRMHVLVSLWPAPWLDEAEVNG